MSEQEEQDEKNNLGRILLKIIREMNLSSLIAMLTLLGSLITVIIYVSTGLNAAQTVSAKGLPELHKIVNQNQMVQDKVNTDVQGFINEIKVDRAEMKKDIEYIKIQLDKNEMYHRETIKAIKEK